MNIKRSIIATLSGFGIAVAVPVVAFAATTSVVTPTSTQGWSTADTRPGGTLTYVNDSTAPGNPSNGALQLKTTDGTAKVQYLHDANTNLSDVNELGYQTKQNSASFAQGDASYQLLVDLNGSATGGFTTLVYEPYQQTGATVTPGTWQSWDVDSGQFWSSRSFSDGTCTVTAGGGGAPFYTLEQLQTACPDAVAVGFGVNVGSGNPGYDVETDLVDFNGTTYNFEPYAVATDKDDCKDNGWKSVKTADGGSFKNQGACVSSVTSQRDAHANDNAAEKVKSFVKNLF